MSARQAVERAVRDGVPTEENMTRLLADIIIFCRENDIKPEQLILSAMLIAAEET